VVVVVLFVSSHEAATVQARARRGQLLSFSSSTEDLPQGRRIVVSSHNLTKEELSCRVRTLSFPSCRTTIPPLPVRGLT
jgi:hypothetical protein